MFPSNTEDLLLNKIKQLAGEVTDLEKRLKEAEAVIKGLTSAEITFDEYGVFNSRAKEYLAKYGDKGEIIK